MVDIPELTAEQERAIARRVREQERRAEERRRGIETAQKFLREEALFAAFRKNFTRCLACGADYGIKEDWEVYYEDEEQFGVRSCPRCNRYAQVNADISSASYKIFDPRSPEEIRESDLVVCKEYEKYFGFPSSEIEAAINENRLVEVTPPNWLHSTKYRMGETHKAFDWLVRWQRSSTTPER